MQKSQQPTVPSLADLLGLLDLQQTTDVPTTADSVWIGEPQTVPQDRVYGGLQLAQAIVSAGRTVPEEQSLLTLQSDFISGVPTDAPLQWHVEHVADTATFSTRRSTIVGAGGKELFSALTRWGLTRTDLPTYMPSRPLPLDTAPDQLPSLAERFGADERVPLWWRTPRPLDVFPASTPPLVAPTPPSDSQTTMLHPTDTVPADAVIRAALAGYVTDMSILEPAFRATGAIRHQPPSRILTLTHTMTFHDLPTWDGWLQFDAHLESLSHGRALGHGQLYDGQGRHLVSASQVGLVKFAQTANGVTEGK